MHRKLRRSAVVVAVAALVVLAIGGSAYAIARSGSPARGSTALRQQAARSNAVVSRKHKHARPTASRTRSEDPSANEQAGENESSSEAENDSAAQAAACQKAGIDPNGDNVQYDDQTGACSLDTGGNNGP